MNYDIWCRHFNGLMNPTCKAGIAYEEVRDSPRHRWPCFKDQCCTERCEHASFLTPEEVAEKEREASEALKAFVDNLANNICPHCKTPIAEKYQVGRCVYARPCGHRLYQGKLKKEGVK